MRYKAVLFDMDGVILDSEPLHVAAFRSVLRRHGFDLTDKEYKSHFAGKTDWAGFESYFRLANESIDYPLMIDQKARLYINTASELYVSYPGVIELIRRLSNQVPLALVTGSRRQEVYTVMQILGVADCFASILTAEDIVDSKPSPEGYLKAAKTLAVDPEDCVVIEDTPTGVSAARSARIPCIAVTNTHTAPELNEADIVVDMLSYNLFV